MEASTKNRRARRAGLGLAGGAVAVLAVTATAWACTPLTHDLKITTPVSKSGPAGTAISVTGVCSVSGCPTGSVALHQDATPSAGVKPVYDHQLLCDTSDPVIGAINFSGTKFTGTGTIAFRQEPGPYIVCAGDATTNTTSTTSTVTNTVTHGTANATTEILWDTFTLV